MQIGVFAAPGRTQWRFVALARVTACDMTAMRAERLRRRIGIVRMRFGSRLLCGGERLASLDDDERELFSPRLPDAEFASSHVWSRPQPALLNGLWWLIGRSVMLPSFPPLSFRVLMRSNSLRFWLHIAYFL
jgi:hypothetical protein